MIVRNVNETTGTGVSTVAIRNETYGKGPVLWLKGR